MAQGLEGLAHGPHAAGDGVHEALHAGIFKAELHPGTGERHGPGTGLRTARPGTDTIRPGRGTGALGLAASAPVTHGHGTFGIPLGNELHLPGFLVVTQLFRHLLETLKGLVPIVEDGAVEAVGDDHVLIASLHEKLKDQ